MIKIIGHRGAKGLEFENTVKGFKCAHRLGLDAIEFDVLATKDGKFVVCHDNFLLRVSGKFKSISRMNYEELAEIHLKNGETIPLLYDVLSLIEGIPLILDVKTDKHLSNLFEVLDRFPSLNLTLVSRHPRTVLTCKKFRSKTPVFIEWYLSAEPLTHFIRHGADGLNLYFLWLNPFIYRLAKKRGMQLHVYTINSVLIARLVNRFFPDVWICSNRPDKLLAGLDRQPKKHLPRAIKAL